MPSRGGTAVLIATALLAGGLGLWFGSRWLQRPGSGPALGSPIAAFSLPDRSGRPMQLPRPGRATLINYWAAWCQPCREEMPLLNAYARRNAASGPLVVGVALDDAGSVNEYLTQSPLGFPVLLEAPGPADSSVRLGDDRGLLPYSVLISADGRLLARRVGPFADEADLQDWANAAR